MMTAAAFLLLGADAAAQTDAGDAADPPAAIWYVDIDAGYRTPGPAGRQRFAPQVYGEMAALDIRDEPAAGAAYSLAAGRRLWRGLEVGLAATYLRTTGGARITGPVPHPLFVGRPRELSHEAGGLRRIEIGAHLQIGWVFPLTERFDLRLSGGPSHFTVRRDGVHFVDLQEVGPPYDQVAASGDQRRTVRHNIPGAHVGLDLHYLLFRSEDPGAVYWTARITAFTRWATASETLPDGAGAVEVGGWQSGVGMRFGF